MNKFNNKQKNNKQTTTKMKYAIILAVFTIVSLTSHSYEQVITANFSCLNETTYPHLKSSKSIELIVENTTVYNAFIQTLKNVSNATFNLTSFVKAKPNGKIFLDFKSLFRVPGVLDILQDFYQQYVIPHLYQEPSKDCQESVEQLLESVLKKNDTLKAALIDFVLKKVPNPNEYIRTKYGQQYVDVDDLVEEQPVLLLEFITANGVSPIFQRNSNRGGGNFGRKPH